MEMVKNRINSIIFIYLLVLNDLFIYFAYHIYEKKKKKRKENINPSKARTCDQDAMDRATFVKDEIHETIQALAQEESPTSHLSYFCSKQPKMATLQ